MIRISTILFAVISLAFLLSSSQCAALAIAAADRHIGTQSRDSSDSGSIIEYGGDAVGADHRTVTMDASSVHNATVVCDGICTETIPSDMSFCKRFLQPGQRFCLPQNYSKIDAELSEHYRKAYPFLPWDGSCIDSWKMFACARAFGRCADSDDAVLKICSRTCEFYVNSVCVVVGGGGGGVCLSVFEVQIVKPVITSLIMFYPMSYHLHGCNSASSACP